MPFRRAAALRFSAPRRVPALAAAQALTLALGVALAAAAIATARAGMAWRPPAEAPVFDRGTPDVPGPGWTDALRGIPELRHEGIAAFLAIALGAALLVVAGTCVNAAAISLSRAAGRRHETALRAALGATPGRVLGNALVSAGVPALLGAGLGIAAAGGALRLLRATWPGREAEWLARGIDPVSLALAAGVPVLAALLFAAVPAVAAARGNLHARLTVGERATAGRFEGWLRRVIAIAQFSVSMALLVGALALVRSAEGGKAAASPGFDPRDTLTMRLDLPALVAGDDAARAAYLESVLARVRATPGVRAASLSTPGAWLGLGPEDQVTSFCPVCYDALMLMPSLGAAARNLAVGPGYFSALGLRVIEGRELTAADRAGAERVVVINSAAARKLFPKASPLGHRLLPHGMFTTAYTVVGVVDDPRPAGVGTPPIPAPAVYFSALQHPPRAVALAVRAEGDPLALAPAVEHAVRTAAPGTVTSGVGTMEALLAESRAPLGWFAAGLGALAVFAALLAAAGVFAVTAQGVARRRREIGVRMALGARAGQVVRMVLAQSARMTRFGAVLGAALALCLERALQLSFVGVHPFVVSVYLGAALLLAAAALAASWVPARRAARVDPLVALQG